MWLTEEQHQHISKWLRQNLWESYQDEISSYNLKHIIQKTTNIYIPDDVMQEILSQEGYTRSHGKSWFYGRVKPEILLNYYGYVPKRYKIHTGGKQNDSCRKLTETQAE
jgi:hypothetical protein